MRHYVMLTKLLISSLITSRLVFTMLRCVIRCQGWECKVCAHKGKEDIPEIMRAIHKVNKAKYQSCAKYYMQGLAFEPNNTLLLQEKKNLEVFIEETCSAQYMKDIAARESEILKLPPKEFMQVITRYAGSHELHNKAPIKVVLLFFQVYQEPRTAIRGLYYGRSANIFRYRKIRTRVRK